jgi:hypothetical protein
MLAESSTETLRALDPDLPFLASEAAVDIENLLANNSPSLDAVRKLALRLRSAIEPAHGGIPPRSLMDPATLTVVAEAVAQSAAQPLSIDGLLAHADKIAASLSQHDLTEVRNELTSARDFCVALSRAAVAYRESIYDLRPSHPYRR